MNKKLVFTFTMIVASSVIGAGFASGKEITTFFGKYGFWTIPFLLLVFALFAFAFYLYGTMGRIIKPQSITDMTKFVFKKFAPVMDILIIICVFIVQSAMIAGADQIGTTLWGADYNFSYIGIFTSLAVVVIVAGGLKSVMRVSNYIMPAIIFFLVLILSQFFISTPKEAVTVIQPINLFGGVSIIFYSFLYISLNTLGNSFLLAQTGYYMHQKSVKKASIISSIMITFFVGTILVALLMSGNVVFNGELPMVQLSYLTNNILGSMYSFVLWFAIMTSIVVSCYMLTKWLDKYIKNDWISAVIIMTVSFAFSRIGFGNIVTIFYPIHGAIGLIYLAGFAIYYFRHLKEIKELN